MAHPIKPDQPQKALVKAAALELIAKNEAVKATPVVHDVRNHAIIPAGIGAILGTTVKGLGYFFGGGIHAVIAGIPYALYQKAAQYGRQNDPASMKAHIQDTIAFTTNPVPQSASDKVADFEDIGWRLAGPALDYFGTGIGMFLVGFEVNPLFCGAVGFAHGAVQCLQEMRQGAEYKRKLNDTIQAIEEEKKYRLPE